MEKNKLFLSIFLILKTLFSFSQNNEIPFKQNSYYFEIGGNGLLYSINIDRLIINRTNWKLSGRLGATINPIVYSGMFGLPMELTTLFGKGNNFLETGFGFTPNYVFDSSKDEIHGFFISSFRLGYRHQKKEGGTIFKVGFTPLFLSHSYFPRKPFYVESDDPFPVLLPWFGIAVGRTF